MNAEFINSLSIDDHLDRAFWVAAEAFDAAESGDLQRRDELLAQSDRHKAAYQILEHQS